jgi:hypothetical protein
MYGCLRAISTVLDTVSSMETIFPQLEGILFPILQRFCSAEGDEIFEELMEIVSYFTYFSPQVQFAFWPLGVPPSQHEQRGIPVIVRVHDLALPQLFSFVFLLFFFCPFLFSVYLQRGKVLFDSVGPCEKVSELAWGMLGLKSLDRLVAPFKGTLRDPTFGDLG